MGIPVVCSTCGRTFRVKDKYAGKFGSCLFCSNAVRVPSSSSEVDALIESHDPAISDSASLLNPVEVVACGNCGRRNIGGAYACVHCGAELG